MLYFYFACAPSVSIDTASSNKNVFDEEEQGNYALLTTARFSDGIGSLELLNLGTFEIQSNLTQNIHSDALTVIDPEDPNTIIQINRLGMDSIRLYVWNEWTVPIVEWSVGERANPHDAVLCGDEILLSMYNRNFIGVYDKDGNLTREIYLSEYVLPEDEDGNPEASSMLRYGDSVFIALNQLNALNAFSTVGNGRILEYSCSAQEITIGKLLKEVFDDKDDEINSLKILLANKATEMLHGKEEAEKSEKTAKEAFTQNSDGANLPTINIKKSTIEETISIIDLIINKNLEKSKSEIRRLIKNNGIKINNEVISDESLKINLNNFKNDYLKLSIGKKRHLKIELN